MACLLIDGPQAKSCEKCVENKGEKEYWRDHRESCVKHADRM